MLLVLVHQHTYFDSKDQYYRKCRTEIFSDLLNHDCELFDFEQSNLRSFRKAGSWWCPIKLSLVTDHSHQCWRHRNNMTPYFDLDLEDSKAFFAWHWLIMNYHITFGNKRLNRSEDIIQVNCQYFEPLLWPWPWTQKSSHSIRHWVTAVHDDVSQYQVQLLKFQQFRRYHLDKH